MKLFDSHAHVDGPEFDADRDDVLARARAAGVARIVVIGAVGEPTSAERAVALAERDPEIWATVATHPHDVAKMTPAWWDVHERLARHPRVVAIGETGLDYYYDHSPRDQQAAAFRRFVELARAVDKPVVCHIRERRTGSDARGIDDTGDAHDDARAILRDTRAAELGCVIHCFTGTPDDARAYAEMGCYVSFSGIVTYKSAQPLRDSVPLVPRDRLLIETDCPYLSPEPVRGRRRNEPAHLVHTAGVVARCAGLELEPLASLTDANACDVYRLKPAA
ncbi:MAG TPA: TatD family hydrolase [Kofleriaceae bacterium]|nr:TatD family hydrolase [Kofleriaceae bacterium]